MIKKRMTKGAEYLILRAGLRRVSTIVDRRVNIGQTIVSDLNTPSLFLIAKDLTRVQIWVSVNAADIGQIRAGQAATSTVNAYPKETFKGTVNKIRLNATTTNNAVTYIVEVITDNADGRLLLLDPIDALRYE